MGRSPTWSMCRSRSTNFLGDTHMKVLVAYESKHGSTKAIAERTAKTLSPHGVTASARLSEEVVHPGEYDAYVIGRAVYYGGWMKEAVAFVRDHEFWLVDKTVWLFSSGRHRPAQTTRTRE